IVQVCTNDSPFLVDSITEAISGLGYRVHLIVHPIMPAGIASGESNGIDESWMHIEITRLAGPEAHERVQRTLTHVLGDVAKAVADWRPMREACLKIVEEIRTSPPATVPSTDVELAT